MGDALLRFARWLAWQIAPSAPSSPEHPARVTARITVISTRPAESD